MEAAKKLQLYFIGLQREDQPTKVETLRKVNTSFPFKEGLAFMINVDMLLCNICVSSSHQEISAIEEELKVKNEIIKKQEKLIEGWKKDLKDQLDKHNNELEKV